MKQKADPFIKKREEQKSKSKPFYSVAYSFPLDILPLSTRVTNFCTNFIMGSDLIQYVFATTSVPK